MEEEIVDEIVDEVLAPANVTKPFRNHHEERKTTDTPTRHDGDDDRGDYSDDEFADSDFADTFGLPVELPSIYKTRKSLSGDATHPFSQSRVTSTSHASEVATDFHSGDTVYITRLPRTCKLLSSSRPMSATASVHSMPSTSTVAEGKQEKPVWHKSYLNELAYNLSTKQKAAQRRKEERKKSAASKASTTSKRPSEFSREGGGNTDFLERLENQMRRIIEARTSVVERADYDSKEKKVCSSCGREQSFDEYKKNIKGCQREGCRGAPFRAKIVWSEVSDRFLGELDKFVRERDENVKTALRKSLPPFRQLTKTEFNPDTNEIQEVPIETHSWREVEGSFFERMEEFKERHEATLKRLEEERQRRMAAEAAAMQGIPKLNTRYEPKNPMPSFYERQQMAADRKKLSFEERVAEYEEKYGKMRV